MTTRNIEPLSHSSGNELLGCEQKYVHRKVQKVQRDADAPMDTAALDIGKCFHQCLEDTNHDLHGYGMDKIKANMARYGVPEDKFDLLVTMLSKYRDLHDKSGLTCIATELELRSDDFVGYIDAVMRDKNGHTWVLDVKTAARENKFLPALLPRDKQLNLYLHEYLKIDPDVQGCIYRVAYKTKRGGARDYIIPRAAMSPDEAGEQFAALRMRQKQLWELPQRAKRNYNHCTSYFRPCEYWSKCHGVEYSATPRVTEVSV